MNKIKLVIDLVLLGALVGQMAAKSQVLVQFPQGPASWTVDIAKSAAPHATQPSIGIQISKMEVAQDAQKRRTEMTMSNGAKAERWGITATNMLLIQAPNGVFGAPNSGDYAMPFFEPAFSWIKPASLVEKDPISYQGASCFHYKGTIRKNAPNGPGKAAFPVEAWIDAKTHLPVALDDGTWLATYTFHPPPYPPLTLPPVFQKDFDRLSR